jgi:hypothetical protein
MFGNPSTAPVAARYALAPSGSMPQRAHFHESNVTSASIAGCGGNVVVYVPMNAMPIVRELWFSACAPRTLRPDADSPVWRCPP